MTTLQQLIDRGYAPEEAQLVLHVVATANAERKAALTTGRCSCGGRIARGPGRLVCLTCDRVHAA